jgi:hypothetical protein
MGAGHCKEATDLGSTQSEIFFRTGLDDLNRIESADEIRFYAQAFFSRSGRSDDGASVEIELIHPSGRKGDQDGFIRQP